MRNRLVHELAVDGTSVAVACRVLGVSESGYYEWRDRPLSARAVADASLSTQIVEIHAMSRGTYGVPRVHAELRLGRGVHCGRKRVARLMHLAQLHGIGSVRTQGPGPRRRLSRSSWHRRSDSKRGCFSSRSWPNSAASPEF